MKLQQDCVNHIFNPNAFFFFLLTGATWYYHAIYIVFTYFASFTGYEDDILEVISNLNVQRLKYGGKMEKFGGKSFKKLNSVEFVDFVFFLVWPLGLDLICLSLALKLLSPVNYLIFFKILCFYPLLSHSLLLSLQLLSLLCGLVTWSPVIDN